MENYQAKMIKFPVSRESSPKRSWERSRDLPYGTFSVHEFVFPRETFFSPGEIFFTRENYFNGDNYHLISRNHFRRERNISDSATLPDCWITQPVPHWPRSIYRFHYLLLRTIEASESAGADGRDYERLAGSAPSGRIFGWLKLFTKWGVFVSWKL